jgi:chromosome segregation ATPase
MAYNSGYWEELEGSLRKQLAEARAENAALVAEFQRLADEPPTLEEIAADLDKIEQLTKELAEARAEIERLKGVVISQITPEPLVLSRYSTTAEPAKDERDKLVEQMREALNAADDLIDEYAADYEHRDNVDEIREEIKAALSAADGGE